MKIKKGEEITVKSSRRGTYKAMAAADFDTEKDEWYPVITQEHVYGVSYEWFSGEDIACRRGIDTIERL